MMGCRPRSEGAFMADAIATVYRVADGMAAVCPPPPALTISEWADRFAVLASGSSAEPGRWRTLPYQRAIQDAFCRPEVEEVVAMKSKRIGWTKILGNVLGYHIHQDPASVLIVQPTIADAEGYSKEEIQPTIDETPVLRERVGDSKSRSSSNTITKKKYPGGMLHLVGANSPTGFRRITVRVVLFDEVDGYPATAGVEGDQIKLGMGRAETFWNRKFGIGSTPTEKGLSRVERHFEGSSKGYPLLTCPHCGGEHIRKFREPKRPIVIRGRELPVSVIQWADDDPSTAAWVCPACGGLIDHSHHRAMLEGLRWFGEHWEWSREAGFNFLPGFAGRIGFHIWAGYSMSPNSTPAHLAREFLEAKQSRELLTVFVNTVLGETWEDEGEQISEHTLMARREQFPDAVPAGAEGLTLGVDVQADRIECELVGWNRDRESWSIDYMVLPGDPVQDDVWADLSDVIRDRYTHESGAALSVLAVCIDAGYLTKRVHAFCAKAGAHVVPVIGRAGAGRPVVESDRRRLQRLRATRNKGKVKSEIVGTDEAKATLYRFLSVKQPGPGFCHFPDDRDEEYFAQLTAEKLVTRYQKGRATREWIKTRERNEATDCRNYAYAAMLLHGFDKLRAPTPTPPPPPKSEHLQPAPRPPRRNFATGWRR